MKRFIAALMCIIMVFTLTACSAENEGGNSVAVKHNAPEIDEFGIYSTEEEFVSELSAALNKPLTQEDFVWGYCIDGNTAETISLWSTEDHLERIVVTVSDATENKPSSVKRATEIFKTVITILYPDVDPDELDDTLKEIRYEEEQNEYSPKAHFYKDVYITYSTNFGPNGLTLSDESVTEANWKIETISTYNK